MMAETASATSAEELSEKIVSEDTVEKFLGQEEKLERAFVDRSKRKV